MLFLAKTCLLSYLMLACWTLLHDVLLSQMRNSLPQVWINMMNIENSLKQPLGNDISWMPVFFFETAASKGATKRKNNRLIINQQEKKP